jgi:hypothetical protein
MNWMSIPQKRAAMTRNLEYIEEPLLEFGHGQRLKDPRDGLFLFGPLAERRPAQIRVGVVGRLAGLSLYRDWLDKAQRFIPAAEPETAHHLAFPGFEAIFQTSWPTNPIIEIPVSAAEIANSIRKTDRHSAIYETVGLFVDPIVRRLTEDDLGVDVWFVVIPDEVWRLGRPLSRPSRSEAVQDRGALGTRLARRFLREPSLFPEDMEAITPYRYDVNFHHQLKARLIPHKAVVQIVRESSLASQTDTETRRRRLQDPATLAWNLGTTAFFKAGGRPWKLADVRSGVCYVGLVFKLNSIDPSTGNACCGAQMFLDSGDGLVFKGAMGPWYSRDRKEFRLTEDAACDLARRVVSTYVELHGAPPRELFIHGRKRFDVAEWRGFRAAVSEDTNVVCVRISRSQEMKLFRPGRTPVLRGTAYRLSESRALLWTAGYVPELMTYAGREVPNPLLVEVSQGEAELDVVLKDVMGLTKVNFNACIFADGLPVTLRFAEAVGEILTAAPHVEGPPLPFRHYI